MIFEKLRKKKDWEDNPYEGCSYFVIKKVGWLYVDDGGFRYKNLEDLKKFIKEEM